MKIRKIILLMWLLMTSIYAQELDLEVLFDNEFELSEHSAEMDELYDLLENPMDVNTATLDMLLKIPWISPQAAQELIAYRQRQKIKDISELKNIAGMRQYYFLIRKFLVVKKRRPAAFELSTRNRFLQELPYKNITETKIYNRIHLASTSAHAGVLTEKDANENKCTDFVSAYMQMHPTTVPFKLTLGNFSARAAQGLVLWSPYGLRKGSAVITPAKYQQNGIVPYSSTDENAALTGGALEYVNKRIQIFAFASKSQLDATIENGFIQAFPGTGLHVSTSQQQKKDSAYEELLGVHSRISVRKFHFGCTALQNRFSHPLAGNLQNAEPGRTYGVDYEYQFLACNFFGETACKNNCFAHVHGLLVQQATTSFIVNWRSFDAHYKNSHAFSFAAANPRNESGLYMGMRMQREKFSLAVYSDRYQRPLVQETDLQPNEAFDFLITGDYRINTKTQFTWRYKNRDAWDSSKYDDIFGNTQKTYTRTKTNIMRLQLDGSINEFLQFRSRAETSWQNSQNQIGHSFYQDFRWQYKKSKLQFRWTFFNIPNYALRIYQYENDVPGMMSNRLLYGSGSRFYVLTTIKIKNFSMNSRYDFTVYYQKPGIEESMPVSENRFSVQLDWKLNSL